MCGNICRFQFVRANARVCCVGSPSPLGPIFTTIPTQRRAPVGLYRAAYRGINDECACTSGAHWDHSTGENGPSARSSCSQVRLHTRSPCVYRVCVCVCEYLQLIRVLIKFILHNIIYYNGLWRGAAPQEDRANE